MVTETISNRMNRSHRGDHFVIGPVLRISVKLCCGEIETYFWRSFRKFIGIGKESNTKAGSGQYIKYYHKDTKWYGIRPFSPKQRHVITEVNHCLLHLSWDEEPEEMRGYHDSKTTAVLYPSIVLLMITDKLNLTEEVALSRMTTPDDCSFKESAES